MLVCVDFPTSASRSCKFPVGLQQQFYFAATWWPTVEAREDEPGPEILLPDTKLLTRRSLVLDKAARFVKTQSLLVELALSP